MAKPAFRFTTRDGRTGTVREARNGDAEPALAITAEAMRERPRALAVTEDEFWTPRDWRRHRMPWSEHGVSLVAEVDGELLGVLTCHRGLRPSVRHTAEFGLTVARRARSRGIGRALIAVAERWAVDHGVTRMTLRVFATNERAHALYRSLGYADEGMEHGGVRFPEGPVDVVHMYKFLDASQPLPLRGYDDRASAHGEG